MIPSFSLRMNVSKWQAIIFDLDDTLYPEIDYVSSGFRAVAAWVDENLQISRKEAYRELWDLFFQGVRGDTFNQWLHSRGIPDGGCVQAMVNVYRSHDPDLRLYPGVRSLLEELKINMALGLLSDGYLEVQRRKLAVLRIEKYFDVVVFSGEWDKAAWKPSPIPFLEAMERLAFQPRQAVYVADNPVKDFLGARKVGMATVRVCWEDGLYAHLDPPTPQHAPDYSINRLDEVKELLI